MPSNLALQPAFKVPEAATDGEGGLGLLQSVLPSWHLTDRATAVAHRLYFSLVHRLNMGHFSNSMLLLGGFGQGSVHAAMCGQQVCRELSTNSMRAADNSSDTPTSFLQL